MVFVNVQQLRETRGRSRIEIQFVVIISKLRLAQTCVPWEADLRFPRRGFEGVGGGRRTSKGKGS